MDDVRILSERRVYRGSVVDLRLHRIALPNGRETELEIVRHPGAAAVVPLTPDGEVVLVRQLRYAPGEYLLEIPAGKLHPGEAPEACARREVEEETGWRAGNLEELGSIWTTPGFTDERIWLFLARDLEPGRAELEDDEILTVETLPLAEAVERVYRGEIRDSKSLAGLLFTARALERG